ncbi:MAG: deaminase [Pseudomonadota bacterium]
MGKLKRYLRSRLGKHPDNASPRGPSTQEHPYSWTNVPSDLRSLFSEQIAADTKHHFMAEAIAEAGKSNLQPTVGAVIVRDHQIIGRGHREVVKLREAPPLWRVTHAEQAALRSVAGDPSDATLYVTLEPCAERFQGRTVETAEVCSVIIPRAGISTVVIGLVDRDPMTFGKGLQRLNKAGVRLEHAYHGLEQELIALVGGGEFGVRRPKVPNIIRRWLNKWF